MQTPRRDNDSEFSYTFPAEDKRYLQSPTKRRRLNDGASAAHAQLSTLNQWQHDAYEEKSTQPLPQQQQQQDVNASDDLQYSIVSGILSPKSLDLLPDSLRQAGTPRELTPSPALHDTPYTTDSIIGSTPWKLTAELPPVPHDKLSKAIPSNVPINTRINQLFIWDQARKLSNPRPDENTSSDVRKADRIVARVQRRLFDQMIKGKVNPSALRHQKLDDLSLSKSMPHPQNEKNRQKINRFQQQIRTLQNELFTWEQAGVDLYSQHAATLDEVNIPKDKGKMTPEMMEDLDDQQRQFLERYFPTHAEDAQPSSSKLSTQVADACRRIQDDIPRMRARVFALRQIQKLVHMYCKDKTQELVERSNVKAEFMPKEEDATKLSDKDLNERKKEVDINIVRLLANKSLT